MFFIQAFGNNGDREGIFHNPWKKVMRFSHIGREGKKEKEG